MASRKRIIGLMIGVAALSMGAQLQAGPSALMLANTCAGCHGTEGKSVGPASPNLAGISEAYFVESMEGFKSGERPATIMDRIAKGYTTEQFESMGQYFAGLPVYKAPQTLPADKVKNGGKVYKKRCAKCHDDGGALPDDDAGILAGQWLAYLQYTMEDYLAGDREMTKKMKKAVKKLNEAELDAVLNYFASQQ